MENAELMKALLEIADGAGLEVRSPAGRPAGEGEPALSSAVCRLRGDVWVVLSGQDPVEVQIDVLARALREHAADYLEGHFLPPAVRARLGGPGGGAA